MIIVLIPQLTITDGQMIMSVLASVGVSCI